MSVLSVRLDKELESKLALLLEMRKIVDKSAYVRQILDRVVSEDLIDTLAEDVAVGKITSWKAAEIAGIPLRAMLKALHDRKIEIYNEASFLEDLKFAKSQDR